jgi:hypothetical protein
MGVDDLRLDSVSEKVWEAFHALSDETRKLRVIHDAPEIFADRQITAGQFLQDLGDGSVNLQFPTDGDS